MRIFKVTVNCRKTGDEIQSTVSAKNDVEARAKVVKHYIKRWNEPYFDDEDGKMHKPTQISERDIYCEIQLVTETDL